MLAGGENRPALCVVVPVHGRLELAERALASLVAQTFAGSLEVLPGRLMEVVVVDDGTPGGIGALMDGAAARAAPAGMIRLVVHDANRGAAAARNTGVREARAELVAFLDSDDEWMPGMAAALSRAMDAAGGDVVGATTGYVLDGASGRQEIRCPRPGQDLLATAVRGCALAPGSALCIRRSAWMDVGGEDEGLERLEDWDLLLRLAERGWRLAAVGQPLARVRHSLPGPPPDVVRRSVDAVLARHLPWVSGRSPVLARRLRAAASYEVGLASLRHGETLAAALALARAIGSDPTARLPALSRSLRRAASQIRPRR